MDNQKEIKEIARILDEAECVEDALFVDFAGMAEALVNAGYGDVKQAVREFAERLKENLEEIFNLAVRKNWGAAYEYVNQLVEEVCGE